MSGVSDLERLIIERACERLVYDFVEAIDLRHYDTLGDIFTEDAVYARPIDPKNLINGLAAIRKVFEGRPANRVARHVCSTVRIDVLSPTAARGTSRVVMYAASADQQPHAQFGLKSDQQLIGGYEDEYVKTASGWRVSSRRGYVFAHV